MTEAAARRRSVMVARMRQFFRERGVLEVETPSLSHFAVTEPEIESLSVIDDSGSPAMFLHTSPEYAMKRLLAAGFPDIFSICRVYRGGEIGRLHQREFTLVEWYRRDFGLAAIAAETVALVAAALDRPALARSADSVDYRRAFIRHAGLDPLRAPIEALAACAGADADLARSLGDRRDAWLGLILATRVAPQFPLGRLTVLRHFPASQAALARLCPAESAVADRFELFCGELELANGYVELTDPVQQRRRFEADNAARRVLGRPEREPDRELLDALEAGLPPCAGVALGLERLHMLAEPTDDIRDVVSFAETSGANPG